MAKLPDDRILGYTPRILVASFLAYLVGEFANSFVLAKMKVMTGGRWLWTRTISSTLIGQGLDSVVFITLAFVGTIPPSGLAVAITTQWLIKSAYEVVATPVTYAVVNFLKHREGLDVYDYHTRFSTQWPGKTDKVPSSPFLLPSFAASADTGHGRIGSLRLTRQRKPFTLPRNAVALPSCFHDDGNDGTRRWTLEIHPSSE